MKPEGLVWRLKLGDVKLLRTLQKFNFIWVWPVFCVAFLFPRNRGIQDTNVRRSSDWGREQARVGRERQGPGRNAIYSRCQERVLGAQLWEAQSGAPPPPGAIWEQQRTCCLFPSLREWGFCQRGGWKVCWVATWSPCWRGRAWPPCWRGQAFDTLWSWTLTSYPDALLSVCQRIPHKTARHSKKTKHWR
jgi:hypothetical protein